MQQDDLGQFAGVKGDPKYQTLPYNTKFSSQSSCTQQQQPNNSTSASSTTSTPTGMVYGYHVEASEPK